jgi:hypothetical protein
MDDKATCVRKASVACCAPRWRPLGPKHWFAAVAQLVEHTLGKGKVDGSIPFGSTIFLKENQ